MATDEERLVVAVEARIRDFERNMMRASRTAGDQFGKIERRAKQSGDQLEKTMATSSARVGSILKTFGTGLAGGIVGGLSAAGFNRLFSSFTKLAERVANVGSAAKRAGVDVKSFQELSYVADQNRISVDALTDGMKELQLRADEWIVTGKGPGAEAFTRLGFTAIQLRDKLKQPADLLVEIIGRMGELDRAAQIRIADELFGGTAGERFVELLDRGATGIRSQIAEARNLGLVLDTEVITRADELDRRFKSIANTLQTRVTRGAILLGSDLMDWADSFKPLEEQGTRQLGDQLADLGQRRLDIENRLLKLRREQADAAPGSPFGPDNAQAIADLEAELRELAETETRILKLLGQRSDETGKAASEAKPPVDALNDAIQGTAPATIDAASGLKTYADAMRALKREIPELADQLATLDARTRIDETYRTALQKARTIGETIEAGKLRDAALSSLASAGAREAASKGMLDLIGFAEGTDKGRGYNETLAYGRFTGGNRNLVTMTLDEVDAMQSAMLRHPDNHFNSSAAGRYQIVQRTLRGLRSQLDLKGDEFFDAGMQDRLAEELLRRRGNDVGGLRNEWEGLRRVDDATIRRAYDGTSVTMPVIDPGQAANLESAREQANAYAEIVTNARQYTAEMQFNRAAMDMTTVRASALRYEQQMLNDAQARGIQVTPQQRAEIQRLATGMATAEHATETYAASQQQAAEVSQFFGQQAVDALTGLLTGTMTAEQALQQLISTLIRAALQAAILGEGPLAGLLGGGGPKVSGGSTKGKTGAGTGILGALLGFAEGGEIDAIRHMPRFASGGMISGPGGPTDDRVPILASDGEFVVNAAATAKHRALLHAINGGVLPGFATGGIVGDGGTVPAGIGGQAITINAPVTVNGSSGTPEQNEDLAKQVSKQMEATMRGVVADEMRKQMRPGNMGNRRGR